MNQVKEIFKQLILQDNNNIKDLVCHNFSHKTGNDFTAGNDNSLFILYLPKKRKWVKITHKISGNVSGLRMKMYYAALPECLYNEEQSYELGFMDGEEYSYVLKLKGKEFDAFRFDFGFEPIDFTYHKFILKNPSFFEILSKKFIDYANYTKSILHFIKTNKISLKRIIRKIRSDGIKSTITSAKTMTTIAIKDAYIDKSHIQVATPYKVEIKHDLLPNRKKVLHIIENFYTGGSSRLIVDIIEHYGHKYDNKIYTMAFRGADEFLNVDVTVIDIDDKKKVLNMIHEYAPDIIHVHIWEGEWYQKVFNLLENVTCKIVENINTPVYPIVKDYIDKYVFVSNYVLENFHDKKDMKSTIIYPGSNFEMFTRELKGDYLAKDTIGMVYRLGYDKLNQFSIDVFIKTVKKRPQTKAIIVGGGPQYEYFVNKVKNSGTMKNFIFTGYVPYIELPSWYEKFTVFVAPVWKESFGQVSPFAMSMGIPVAGYNIGAINEIIDNKELLASVDNSDELSDILVRLLDDYDLCLKIGRFNQSRAWEKFGVKTMVDDYDTLYTELTSK